jgi:hypothetical protein
MTDSQAAATRFCARVIGPLMLIIGAIVLARFDELLLMAPRVLHDAPLSFITGMFTLIVGLILFAAHHHWSGVTAIIVSLMGVLTIVRGVILMTAPGLAADVAMNMMQAGPGAWIAGGVAILIGLWLTYAGWLARAAG